jgi:ubiquitin-protein ligase
MTTGSQQLADDYGQLKELLELYPHITILRVEGDPPDHYELAYHLRGYVRADDGEVGIGTDHQVRISLPFGYPHFAPIAKPLTPIFHPDVDPAAFRIADHWQQNPSLADLVLRIGEMICGSVYQLDEPFNREAADWYAAHQGQLPLDTLSLADIEQSQDRPDSLAEDTFASLGLESDDFLDPEKEVAEEDVQQIRDLIVDRKIFTANRLLGEFPATAAIPDREEMQQQIGKVLRKTDQFFKLAEQLEGLGKYREAIEVVDDLLAVAVDAPGAEALRARIQQSQLTAGAADDDEFSEEEGLLPGRRPTGRPPAQPPAPPPGKWRLRLERVPKPSRAVIFAVLAAASCTGVGLLAFRDFGTLQLSQDNIRKARQLLDARQFDSAQATLEAARTGVQPLSILRFRKAGLDREIAGLLDSPELREGLQGKVLYGGEYIPVDTATALQEVQALTDRARALADENKVGDALALYQQALQLAVGHRLEQRRAAIEESMHALELHRTLSAAEQAEQGRNWVGAAESYRKALRLSGELTDRSTASDITHRLTAAVFRQELDRSKKTFDQAQWQDTIASLERARELIAANPAAVSASEREEVRQLLVNARLYRMLAAARAAYQQRDWELAIREYRQALALLAEEAASGGESLAESVTKVEKTLLLVRLAQVQEQVERAENRGDLNGAVSHRREILTMIRRSGYAQDKAVKAVADKVNAQIGVDLAQQEVTRQIAWLEKNFEALFRTNYPTFAGSELVQPRAVLLKKIGRDRVYTLSCVERSQGSSAKLELLYRFNAETGQWSVYKEK